MFAVDRKHCLGSPKADRVRCGSSRAWVWIACLSFAAMLPVRLRSQTPPHMSVARSVDANKRYRAGVTLAEQGKLDEAISTFEKALESDRQNPLLLDAIGAAYIRKGDLEQAKQYFLECLDVDPGFVRARKNLAITDFNTGQYDLAAAEFQKLKNISTASHPVANLFLGMIAEKNADYVQAEPLLEQSGALLDRYPEALLSLANAEFQLKHLHRAQVALSNFDNAHAITASQYLKAAELYSRLGLNGKALADLDKARAKDGQLERFAYQRAHLLDQMNRSQEALTILKDLAAKNPDSDSLNLLAHIAQKNGDFGLAMQSLQQGAKLDPAKED